MIKNHGSTTILSYNINEGGVDRLDHIVRLIRAQRPDAIALLEASDREGVETIAQQLEMEFVFGEANNPEGHISWLTSLPVRRWENHSHSGLAKTLLEIEVDTGIGPLHGFATHLASRWDPMVAVDEISIILKTLASLRGLPHLLVGDFNALRPGDPVGEPPPGVAKRGEANDGTPRNAIRMLLDAGYLDCYRALHPDSTGYTYSTAHPWLRLDCIFASPEMADHLASCDVIREDPATHASDHFPIWARFRGM